MSGDARTLPHDPRNPLPRADASGGHARVDAYSGAVLDGRYVLDRLLGEGGMGVVYLGRHKSLDKRVAVKILKRELAEDRDMLERFFNEARAASSIGSHHIVDIVDFGMLPDGAAYFVMEMLDGRSLGALMDELKILPSPRLVGIARQIAEGLQAAHAAGIVHRDLKPDNIMLVARANEPDFVKILDFGIAKVANAASRLTRTGSVFGTPHYMSPEQAAGLAVDSRGDIYALGIILYEMACGKVPFDSDNYMGILTQHMYKAPPPPRTLVVPPNSVSPGLEAIILKCLTKKPEGRYQDMNALVADLDALAAGITPGAVGELMARSGNYNVPADYFHQGTSSTAFVNAATLAPASSQHRRTRNMGIFIGVGVGLVLGAGMIVYVLGAGSSSAKGTPSPSASAPVVAVSAPPVVPPVPVTPGTGAAPAEQKKVVGLVVSPGDAHVTLASGAAVPVDRGVARVDVTAGPVKVTVAKTGFSSSEITLGPASGDIERVDLAPAPKAGSGKPSAPGNPVASTPAPPTAPAPPPTAPKNGKPAYCAGMKHDDTNAAAYPECFR